MERKPFLLRIDPVLLEALQRWADDDLRSLNGQLEFLLRQSLQDAGRQPSSAPAAGRKGRSREKKPPEGGAEG